MRSYGVFQVPSLVWLVLLWPHIKVIMMFMAKRLLFNTAKSFVFNLLSIKSVLLEPGKNVSIHNLYIQTKSDYTKIVLTECLPMYRKCMFL